MIIEVHNNFKMLNNGEEYNHLSSPPSRDLLDSNGSRNKGLSFLSARTNEMDGECYDSSSSTTGSSNEGDKDLENRNSLGYYKEYSDSDKGKDSGIECSPTTDEDFPEPNEDLMKNIIKQVEYYFSNAGLLKDPFLLKHVRRNKQGYVSLKLIASFRKVKRYTKNWKVLAHSLKRSEKLEINNDGTKVRRKEPLPDYDETAPSRTIVAFKLPFEKPTVENVGEIFSKCGDITLIRIVRPDGVIPTDIKKFLHKHPEIGASVCALVEFEKHESVAFASKDFLSKHVDWRYIHVIPLVEKTSLNPNNDKNDKKGKGNEKKKEKRQDLLSQLRKSESSKVSNCSEKEHSSSDFKYFSLQKYSQESVIRPHSFSYNQKVSESRSSFQENVCKPSIRKKSNSYSDGDSSSQKVTLVSPWVQRRIMAAKEKGHNGAAHNSRLLIPDGVIRLPRGPDGTTGFSWSQIKLRTQSASSSMLSVEDKN
ncbi:la-related protein 6-like [Tachypleus tridentatus]|uniref:la-related protein 6-like n=1 Tax=Tachypleus tridentatus TaxID=6853 RepID=UPI003FD50BB0